MALSEGLALPSEGLALPSEGLALPEALSLPEALGLAEALGLPEGLGPLEALGSFASALGSSAVAKPAIPPVMTSPAATAETQARVRTITRSVPLVCAPVGAVGATYVPSDAAPDTARPTDGATAVAAGGTSARIRSRSTVELQRSSALLRLP
ncbi:hypothetical protein ABZ746_26885 [Streptomyces sp. NPDC020096]